MIKENFIDAEAGNLQDLIYNYLFKLQRYINKFNIVIPQNAKKLQIDETCTDIVNFLNSECENITKNNILRISVDITITYKIKYNSFVENIFSSPNDTLFSISPKCKRIIINSCNQIDDDDDVTYYHYINKSIDSSYGLDNYMEDMRKVFNLSLYDNDRVIVTRDELGAEVNNLYGSILISIKKIKRNIEHSPSFYSSMILIKHMIDYLYFTYVYMRHIKIC